MNGKRDFAENSRRMLGLKHVNLEMLECHASALKNSSFCSNLLCLPGTFIAHTFDSNASKSCKIFLQKNISLAAHFVSLRNLKT